MSAAGSAASCEPASAFTMCDSMAANHSARYDAIVIGGGHNGLVNAAYLARAGKKVLVLERRHVVGGAAVTEEIFPGFKFSVCSYVVSLLRPEIIRDLDLPTTWPGNPSPRRHFHPDAEWRLPLAGERSWQDRARTAAALRAWTLKPTKSSARPCCRCAAS